MEKWLKELNNEITLIFHHLDLYKKLSEIIDNNKSFEKMDNTLLIWMRKSFTVDLVIGIGRICDNGKETKSLIRFLHKLKKNEQYLTRKRYIKLCTNSFDDPLAHKAFLDIQNIYFDNLAGKGVDIIPGNRIDKDIVKLTKQDPCKKILDFRNEYIAHLAKIKKPAPIYNELFEAFKIIEEIANKYNTFITGGNMVFTPIMQGYWSEVLTIPWINNKHEFTGCPKSATP